MFTVGPVDGKSVLVYRAVFLTGKSLPNYCESRLAEFRA